MADAGNLYKDTMKMLFAAIQATGGAALAVYTYKNSSNPISTIAYSGVALAGTYYILKNTIMKSPINRGDKRLAVRQVVTGTLIYSWGLYGFSKAWKSDGKLWIACLGTAAFGFCFAITSLNNLKISSAQEPHLKFCQFALEPALSVCGTLYLLCFGNHDEECLFWIPIFLTGATGLACALNGFYHSVRMGEHTKLLLKTIQVFMGGLILTTSSTVLAIYGSRKAFSLSWRACMIVGGCIGVFDIFGSTIILMQYFELEEDVLCRFCGMIIGQVSFFSGCLMIECMDFNTTTFLLFLLLTGFGHTATMTSFYGLYSLVPQPLFNSYCQRVLGSLLALYSSAASAYIGYHMGWRFSLPIMAFVPAGVYITCKGFKEN